MRVVWLAQDTKLERPVAVKFLPSIIGADPSALTELKEETRRGLEFAHPNIARIFDFIDDEAAAAIRMEYVNGIIVTELRMTKPQRVFTVDEICPWIGHMCYAPDYAHLKKHIVHRYLNAANLMSNSDSDVKITDFGIASSLTDTMSRISRSARDTSGTLL